MFSSVPTVRLKVTRQTVVPSQSHFYKPISHSCAHEILMFPLFIISAVQAFMLLLQEEATLTHKDSDLR